MATIQAYIIVKIHQMESLKPMHFILCESNIYNIQMDKNMESYYSTPLLSICRWQILYHKVRIKIGSRYPYCLLERTFQEGASN